MLTWDGLRAGSGVPLRLHANAGYTFQGDETRFLNAHSPLPLALPSPVRNRDNNQLTLGGAVEFDLPRFTLFGEVVTDQFVHERTLLTGKENRIAVTPGVRFWLPGGLSIAGAYSMNLSDDDGDTAFEPRSAYPDHEWRVAVSLGTIYRGARAKAEDEARELHSEASKRHERALERASRRREILKQRASELQSVIEELEERRAELASATSVRLVRKYEQLRSAGKSEAVVGLLNGNCGGCLTVVPAQNAVEIKNGVTYICPICGRYIVWTEDSSFARKS